MKFSLLFRIFTFIAVAIGAYQLFGAEGLLICPATLSTDFAFEPKVWKEHIAAYFRDKLAFGAIAASDDSLTAAPGETINFPFFTQVGEAEEPAETDVLTVDNLADDSFQATVKEIGKAVGVKKKAFKVSAARTERIVKEITSQIGRRHAEKVDSDLFTEMSTSGNFTNVNVGTGPTVQKVNTGKVTVFGDLHTEAMALQIHSLDMLAIVNDSANGFLKADATDPMYGRPGFTGRLLGMAVFELDKVGQGACYAHKMDPYGYILKQDMELESDYDILAREWVFTGNQWYAVKSFHAKISADDKKTAKISFV